MFDAGGQVQFMTADGPLTTIGEKVREEGGKREGRGKCVQLCMRGALTLSLSLHCFSSHTLHAAQPAHVTRAV